jgi:molybdopterin-guanine dinucleotide biosynthesis protein A
METIIVTPKNKKAIPFLKHLLSTLQDVDKVEVVNLSKNRTEESIENGLKDLQDIISGKNYGKSLKELLDED